MDPFASHIIRVLLLLLSSQPATDQAHRSKKSASYKARQGPMKSVLADEEPDQSSAQDQTLPKEFREMADRFVQNVHQQLDGNETRALAGDKVGSPALKVHFNI